MVTNGITTSNAMPTKNKRTTDGKDEINNILFTTL